MLKFRTIAAQRSQKKSSLYKRHFGAILEPQHHGICVKLVLIPWVMDAKCTNGCR